MKKIFFITGASGAGKSTLVSKLKYKYGKNDDWIFLHFDSIGVPTSEDMIKQFGSGENWQKEMIYRWIDKMLNRYSNKNVIIFEGQVNLKFIKDGFLKNNFSNYKIILIDCSDDVMKERLTCRNQPELFNNNMKNWLKYLRNQAEDFGIDIINTSTMNKNEVVQAFKKIMKK